MEQQFLEGLKRRDPKTISQIYRDCFPKLLNYIIKNKGSRADAEDVFQDTLLVVYRKIEAKTIDIKYSFHCFLFGIGRYIWWNTLKHKHRTIGPISEEIEFENDFETEFELQEKYLIYKDKFQTLSKNCQHILQLFFEHYSMKEIADILGYESSGYVKKRKCICQKRLIEMIKKDLKYKEVVE